MEILTIHQRDSRLRQVDTLQLRQPLAKKSVGQQAFSVPECGMPYQQSYDMQYHSQVLSVKLRHFYSQNTTLYTDVVFIIQRHYF